MVRSMPTFDYDAVIAGAGAAGLMAAIRAAERGRRVLLLEKKKPGVKILMSGGTRCNITHDCDTRGIVEAFGPNGKFLHSAARRARAARHGRVLRGRGRRHQGRGDGQGLPGQQPRRRCARRAAPPARTAAARRSPSTNRSASPLAPRRRLPRRHAVRAR